MRISDSIRHSVTRFFCSLILMDSKFGKVPGPCRFCFKLHVKLFECPEEALPDLEFLLEPGKAVYTESKLVQLFKLFLQDQPQRLETNSHIRNCPAISAVCYALGFTHRCMGWWDHVLIHGFGRQRPERLGIYDPPSGEARPPAPDKPQLTMLCRFMHAAIHSQNVLKADNQNWNTPLRAFQSVTNLLNQFTVSPKKARARKAKHRMHKQERATYGQARDQQEASHTSGPFIHDDDVVPAGPVLILSLIHI